MSEYFLPAVMDRQRATAVDALQRIEALDRLARPDSRWLEQCRAFDVAKALRDLTVERCTGLEREVSDELDRRYRRTEPNALTIPWETLAYRAQRYAASRADIAGTSAAGGYLVPTLNTDSAAGSLLSLLILGQLGATAVSSTANLNLPKVNSSASTYWLSTEQTSLTESDQTFGQVAFSPHTVGGYTEMSRLLVLQSSPDAGDVVANDLVRKVKRTIEAAAFSGGGTAGQPRGLIGLSGVNAVSGTSFALSTVGTAVGDIGDALDVDSNPGWAAARSVAITLRQRQEFTNGTRALWEGPATFGTLASYNAAASSGVPAATAVFGAWKFLTLVDFGGGLVVSVNPYGGNVNGGGPDASNFQRGMIGLRCFAVIDVAPVWPGAFSVVSAIT